MHPIFNNPNLPPRFDIITPSLIDEALAELLISSKESMEKLEKEAVPTWECMFERMHRELKPICYVWGILQHELSVMNSEEWRNVDQKYRAQIIDFFLKLEQNEKFFSLTEEMNLPENKSKLNATQQRLLEKSIKSNILSGIQLKGEAQEKFNNNQRKLGELSTKFSNNILDATKQFKMVITNKEEIAGLPVSSLRMAVDMAKAAGHQEATIEEGPWVITLDFPLYGPFLKYAECRTRREELYKAFITRASSGDIDNRNNIDEILKIKYENAQILGYNNFAEISISQKMADKVENAEKLINDLIAASKPKAIEEHKTLIEFAQKHNCPYDLEPWDISFWHEKMRVELYDFDEEVIRNYLQFPKVLEGLFGLTKKLFNVTIKAADGETPVWHEDVLFFKIYDENNKEIAAFYLDAYARSATKRGGAWMNICLGKELLNDGSLVNPIAYLVCNQTPPSGDKPSLMSFYEVSTLFHEFGHGLQHMLTKIEESGAAGINSIEWDAVELASQFMENWCWQQETFLNMTSHVETEEQLPVDIFNKMYAARNYGAAGMTLRQCRLSLLDLELYAHYDPNSDVTVDDVTKRVNDKTTIMPPLAEDQFLCSFSHIFSGGYCAGYYSYKWSEVLSADAFEAFEEAGLDNDLALQEVGARYRNTILALGGSIHPLNVFVSFRGREPKTDALLRHQGLLK